MRVPRCKCDHLQLREGRAVSHPLGASLAGRCPSTYDIVANELSLLEVLVGPIQQGNVNLQAGFKDLLLHSTNVRMVAVSRAVLERAVALRAATSLKTPDAIHAATALIEGCTLFVTNDTLFRRVPGLNVTVLRDLLSPVISSDATSPLSRVSRSCL
jgi:predicted nucleic acid-binding protein